MLKYMDRFISHKKIKLSPSCSRSKEWLESSFIDGTNEEESTDVKLTTLVSLYPHVEQSTLLDILVASNGSVDSVCQTLKSCDERSSSKKSKAGIGYQSSLSSFRNQNEIHNKIPVSPSSKPLTRKGQTLHLYAPEDVETHTPCSIIHNFLPAQEAENLLKELLQEATTFEQLSFKVFDNVVQSPHTACFYVDSLEEQKVQRTEYLYNGSHLNVGW